MKKSTLLLLSNLAIFPMGNSVFADDKDSSSPSNEQDQRRDSQALKDTERRELGLTPNLCRVTDVIGKKVVNEQGESLGKIEEVVLDAPRGRIVYAVLSFGGILGIGDKLFAIPWNSLKDQPGKKSCLLNVDKEKLKKAPGFDKSNWPDMANPRWEQDIREYYGVEPLGAAHGKSGDFNFGAADLKREPVKLLLRLKEGQTYRYGVDAHPAVTADGLPAPRESKGPDAVRPAAGSTESMELSFNVTKVSGDESTIEVTCKPSVSTTPSSAGKDEKDAKHEACRFTVMKDGRITAAGEPLNKEGPSGHVKAQLEHIFGYRLHDGNLEPGKEITMPGSIHDLQGHPAAAGTAEHRMRYEGVTRLDGQRDALFAIVAAPGDSNRDANTGFAPVRDAGRVAYRVDDGMLDRLILGHTSIRRLSTERNDAGN